MAIYVLTLSQKYHQQNHITVLDDSAKAPVQWFRAKQLLSNAFIALILIVALYSNGNRPNEALEFIIAYIIMLYCLTLQSNLTSLLNMRTLIKNPDLMKIHGEMIVTKSYNLHIIKNNCSTLLILIGLITFMSPNPFTYGALAANIVLLLSITRRISKASVHDASIPITQK